MKERVRKKQSSRWAIRNHKQSIRIAGHHSRFVRLAYMLNRPKEYAMMFAANSIYGKTVYFEYSSNPGIEP